MNGPDLPFACRCGTVRGRVRDVRPGNGRHLVCHCKYCRAAQMHFGGPDPMPGGVPVWQTTPDLLEIDAGHDQLAALKFSDREFIRWHASCCRTLICTTLDRRALPLIGLQMRLFSDHTPFGPVATRTFVPKGGKTRHDSVLALYGRAFLRTVRVWFSGRWRKNPFFDAKGRPVAEPTLIDAETREKLAL